MLKKAAGILAVLAVFIFTGCGKAPQQAEGLPQGKKIKAGFIYVGPVGDYGWSHAHEMGRQYVMRKFPWLESVFVESVSEGDAPRIIDRLVREEKCDIIFTTSFGYMDATVAAGQKYPNTKFMHCSGFKRAPNVGTYYADFYQLFYINGLMAGKLTASGRIGYVAAQPIPEVIRHINAFAIGIKEANPKAKLHVKWLFSWYDPAKAKEAAQALVAQGCDVLAQEEDSAATVLTGQEYSAKGRQVFTFSHYSPMQKFGPDSVVSGQLVDWGVMYEDILARLYAGVWDNRDYYWMVREKAVLLGGAPGEPVNPKFESKLKALAINDSVDGATDVYELSMKRYAQFADPGMLFDPFTGPLYDQNGKLRLKKGERADLQTLLFIDWFADNIADRIPSSK